MEDNKVITIMGTRETKGGRNGLRFEIDVPDDFNTAMMACVTTLHAVMNAMRKKGVEASDMIDNLPENAEINVPVTAFVVERTLDAVAKFIETSGVSNDEIQRAMQIMDISRMFKPDTVKH